MTTKPIFLALLLLVGWTLSAQPANDNPCNAIALDALSACTPITYTNVAATNSSGIPLPGCAGYAGGDVWFSFTLPNNGYHVILEATMGSMVNGGMAVYSGPNCSVLSLVDCDDMTDSQLSIRVEDGCSFADAGKTFWVRVWDNGNANNGTFDLCAFTMYPTPPPTAVACAGFAPPGNTCCDATILSDGLDGYCGSTNGYTDEPASIPAFCAFLDNNSWVAFVAGSDQVILEVTSFNCLFGNGIQVAILETSDCTNFSIKSNCWNPGTETSGFVTATNMTPGETYYLMVDGWAGDVCDYTVRVIEGIQTTSATVSDDSICAGQSVQLETQVIGAGPFSYNWSPAGSLDNPTSPNPIATPSVSTDYTVTITGALDSVHTVSVFVETAPPAMPSVVGPASVCENETGVSYSVSGASSFIYSWTISGGGTIVGSTTDSTVIVDWGTTTGTLCVSVFNECGASSPGCKTVNMIPRPDISAQNPPATCAPNGVDLTSIVITNNTFGGGPVSYYASEADAIAGTPTLSSPIVFSGGEYWIRMDSGPNCFDYTSVMVVIQNPQIVINTPPATCSPNTYNLSNLIINETNGSGPPSGLSYYLDSLDAVNSVNALASTIVSSSGTYWVRYETSIGCFDVASVYISIYPRAAITIDAAPVICASESIDLNTIPFTDANNTTIAAKYFYTSMALANSGIPALAMSNTVVSNAGPYYMRVVTDNGCPTVVPITITILPLPEIDFSVSSTAVCSGGTVDLEFILTGTPPFTIVYSDGTNNITRSNINMNSYSESVTINSTTTFSLVSVADATSCPGQLNSGSVTITANPLPTATLSGNATICNGSSTSLVFNFTGNGLFNVVYTDGTNNFSVNGIADGSTTLVSPVTATTYSLVSVSDANSCGGSVSGTAQVLVSQPLQITNLVESCNSQFSGYSVSFEISGGDPSSYAVGGNTGTLNGNLFTSDEIAAGVSYAFTISDASGCPAVNITGVQACQCSNDAGVMDPTMQEVCQNAQVVVAATTGSSLMPGHLLQYVLHDNAGATLGNIYAISNSPAFVFQLGMSLNTTYYISPIAGPNDGSGNVDVNHNCFAMAPGTPLMFVETPAAGISGSADICNGGAATLTINISAGIAPLDIVYSDGANTFTLDNVPDGFTFDVSPSATTTYTILSIADNTSAACNGTIGSAATVTVWEAPVAGTLSYECDAINTSFRVLFAVSGGDSGSYNFAGDPGAYDTTTRIFTSDWMVNGTAFNFAINDINNCGPTVVSGTYECTCTSFAGTMNSTLQEACEDETVSFIHDENNIFDGNDALGFVLHDLGAGTPGNILLRSSTPVFTYDPVLAFGQVYYVSAVVADNDGTGFPVLDVAQDRCLSFSDGQPVMFYPIVDAWITGPASICEGETEQVVLHFSEAGQFDAVINDGQKDTILTAVSDGFVYQISPTVTTSYSLVSVASSSGPRCSGNIDPTTAQINVSVIEVPEVQNLVVDCDNMGTFFTLTFEITGGNAAAYQVGGNTGQLNGNIFTSDVLASGSTYYFEITDGSGCPPVILTATEYCKCTPDIQAAISVKEGISCPEDADGSLQVANINGAAPFSFVWNTGSTSTEINDLAQGWYYVTMTDGNFCTREDSILLNGPEPIAATLESTDVSCFGEDDGEIKVLNVTGGAGGFEYTIEEVGSAYQDIFYQLTAGEYHVRVTDQNGCTWIDSIEVTEPEELYVNLGADMTIELGDSIELIALTNLPVDSFRWNPDAVITCQGCPVQMVKPDQSLTYSVQVMTEAGCRSQDEIRINVAKVQRVYIPTAFSPNGDGRNDYFTVYAGKGVKAIHSLNVYSRWGELLFSTKELTPGGEEESGWNGRFKSRIMPPGAYTYYTEVEFIDGSIEMFKGAVNLIE